MLKQLTAETLDHRRAKNVDMLFSLFGKELEIELILEYMTVKLVILWNVNFAVFLVGRSKVKVVQNKKKNHNKKKQMMFVFCIHI